MDGIVLPNEVKECDVIIIGCGLSGMTAAYEMLKLDPNIKLCLLEAKDRIGGRTLTNEINIGGGQREKFDLGGQWVASSQPDILEILEELNIKTYPQFINGTKIMQVGQGNIIRTYKSDIPSLGSYWGVIELQLFIWKAEKLAKQISIEDPYSWDKAQEYDAMTMETFVRNNARSQSVRDTIQAACRSVIDICILNFRRSSGCDLDRVSALFFLAYANSAGGVMKLLLATENGAQELRVKGGTQQISEILADRIGRENVQLNQPVSAIYQDQTEFITVHTLTGKIFRARHVITSIPPNCVTRIQFSPPLSEDRKLLMDNMPVGHLTKFIITYDKTYWRENGFSGEIVSNGGGPLLKCSTGPISVVYDATTDKNVPALVGFVAGRPGVEWHRQTAEERRSSILACLAEFFGSWALQPTSFTEKVWADEEYNGGCPVCFGVPGVMFTFSALRRPHGRIHWCGTETSTHWAGYLNGAVQSGRRAACEVMKLNGKNVTQLEKLVSRQPSADVDPLYSFPSLFTPIVVSLAVITAFVAVYFF
ncbi:probable flavin-containing monoamine oxidase A isoform X1 [Daphnia carinata]|uniref:probable flavin-containing monoamine oxidase A isoform X1 n=1 Tax=Daphnia carinata TaxID=120202 RepID=UPI00257A0527|nr:probable flavin-containing monoamine oxidase A isoform X1 [Daphnia carinata]